MNNKENNSSVLIAVALLTAVIAVFALLPLLSEDEKKADQEQEDAIYRVLNRKKSKLQVPLPKDLSIGFRQKDNVWHSSSRVGDEDVLRLVKANKVIGLRLNRGDITAKSIIALQKKRIQSLFFFRTDINSQILTEVSKLKTLKILSINITSSLDDQTLKHLKGPKTLKSLSISNTKITDLGVKFICSTFPNLKVLLLKNNALLTKKSVDYIVSQKSLEELDLRYIPVNLESVKKLKRLANLQVLQLGGYSINDSTIDAIKNFPLKKLTLREAEITDRSLKVLQLNKSIRKLNLGKCKNLTSSAVRSLKVTRPDMRVRVEKDKHGEHKGNALVDILVGESGLLNKEVENQSK